MFGSEALLSEALLPEASSIVKVAKGQKILCLKTVDTGIKKPRYLRMPVYGSKNLSFFGSYKPWTSNISIL
jgi:hypothetical protein